MRGNSGVGDVQWVDVKERGDVRGDVASGLRTHWCRGESPGRQGEGRYSARLGDLGRDDVSVAMGTGRGDLDVCERQRGIVGDKTWHLTRMTDQRRPLAILVYKWSLGRIPGRITPLRNVGQMYR